MFTHISSLDCFFQHFYNIVPFTVCGLVALGPAHQSSLLNINRSKGYGRQFVLVQMSSFVM